MILSPNRMRVGETTSGKESLSGGLPVRPFTLSFVVED